MNRLRYLTRSLLLSGLLAGGPLLAQDTTRQFVRPAVLKTNLGEPISLVLEVPTTNRQSLQVSAQYFGIDLFSRVRSFSMTPAYKFYLTKSAGSARRPAPKGFYLSSYLRYRWIESEGYRSWGSDAYAVRISSTFGGGVVMGAQFINRWGFTLDGFLGGGYNPLKSYQVTWYNLYNSPNPPRTPDSNWLRYDIRIGLCIGIAFAQPGTH